MKLKKNSLGLGKTADTAGQWKAAVFCAWIAIGMSLGHSHNAFAQSKAAQTAAGAYMMNSIIQQNRTRQELNETKKELRAIREGLGIEAESPPELPKPSLGIVVLVVLVGVLFVGSILRGVLAKMPICGGRQATQRSFLLWLGMPSMFAWMLGFPVLVGHVIGGIGPAISLLWVVGMPVLLLASYAFGGSVYDRRLSCRSPGLGYDRRTSSRSQAVGALAVDQTTDEDFFKSSPSREVVAVKSELADIYIRTPQGRRGGPFTRNQVLKAVSAGKIPGGTLAAKSPDGPWMPIRVKGS
jgi:hypothetical protein